MPFIVTAIEKAPSKGFISLSRYSADGIREAATRLLAEGLQEIEIRDPRGNLLRLRDIERPFGDYPDPLYA